MTPSGCSGERLQRCGSIRFHRTGKPNSSWGNAEVDYLPVAQREAGPAIYGLLASSTAQLPNYDGAGRNASDNNHAFCLSLARVLAERSERAMKNATLFASAGLCAVSSGARVRGRHAAYQTAALDKVTTVCQNCHGPNGEQRLGRRFRARMDNKPIISWRSSRISAITAARDPHAMAYMWGMALAARRRHSSVELAKYYASQKPMRPKAAARSRRRARRSIPTACRRITSRPARPVMGIMAKVTA